MEQSDLEAIPAPKAEVLRTGGSKNMFQVLKAIIPFSCSSNFYL